MILTKANMEHNWESRRFSFTFLLETNIQILQYHTIIMKKQKLEAKKQNIIFLQRRILQ